MYLEGFTHMKIAPPSAFMSAGAKIDHEAPRDRGFVAV
jgi:hypothetical protein